MKIIQVNLNRSRNAHDLLDATAYAAKADLLLVSEPNRGVAARGDWLSDVARDAAIRVISKETKVVRSGSGQGYAWAELDEMVVVSVYLSPNDSLQEMVDSLDSLSDFCHQQTKGLLIGGDFNAKSPAWTGGPADRRGRVVMDFAGSLDLTLLNDGVTPTWEARGLRSIIDLTFASVGIARKVQQWRVLDDETLSDHRYIAVEIATETRGGTQPYRPPRWRYKPEAKESLRAALQTSCATVRNVEELAEGLVAACRNSLSQVRTGGRRPAYWWTDGIADLRRACVTARRSLARERRRRRNQAEPGVVLELEEAAARTRAALRWAIKQSKRECWFQLCAQLDENIWGEAYRIARKKLTPYVTPTVEVLDGCLRELFPQRPPPHYEAVDVDAVPLFSLEELKAATKRISPSKAPGPDGVPPEAVKLLCETMPDNVLEALNDQLAGGRFPREWRRARLVLIPKLGKPVNDPRGYRPICLLDSVGKLYEQLLQVRLREEVAARGGVSQRQYGFRQGRSTIDAVRAVMQTVEAAAAGTWRTRLIPAVLMFDVRNAFNSASWEIIAARLAALGISPYLRSVVQEYLSERELLVEKAGIEERVPMTCGVPQGSVLGPLLWNILYDGILRQGYPTGTTAFAYADDLALVVTARTEEELERNARVAVRCVERHLLDINLQLAPEKTEAVIMAGRRVLRPITIAVGGHQVVPKTQVKYLGVWLEKNRTFRPHLREAVAKAEGVGRQLTAIMANVGGPRCSRRKCLATVVQSVALYAAPVWARELGEREAGGTRCARELLRRVDRLAALRVTCAYRTVSSEAACVVGGVKPTMLLARERAARFTGQDPTAAREALWTSWESLWQETPNGAWTRRLIPRVRPWVERGHGEVDHWLTQFLTGHGAFESYLHRFGRRQSPICTACGAIDTAEHAAFECYRWGPQRRSCWTTVGTQTPETIVGTMMGDARNWGKIAEFLTGIVKAKAAENPRNGRRRGP